MRNFVSGVSRTSNERHATAASIVVTVLTVDLYVDSETGQCFVPSSPKALLLPLAA